MYLGNESAEQKRVKVANTIKGFDDDTKKSEALANKTGKTLSLSPEHANKPGDPLPLLPGAHLAHDPLRRLQGGQHTNPHYLWEVSTFVASPSVGPPRRATKV